VPRDRIDFRLRTRYVDEKAETLDEALAMIDRWTKGRGEVGRPARQRRRDLAGAGARAASAPTCVTDQTSAHDPINGYLPQGWTLAEWREKRERDPKAVEKPPAPRCASACRGDARLLERRRADARLRQQHPPGGARTRASRTPSPSPASCRPISARCSAAASARSAGRRCRAIPEDIYKTDAKVKELIPDNAHLHNWLDMARERIAFQGLPARICWVGLGDRHRLGLAFNEMVAKGELKAPGRHRPRSSRFRLGRLAQPRDRSDEGRLGRRVRLAAAQRAAQHRLGRDLGVAASWRRRRHGLLAAFRHGHLCADGTKDAARASSACCGTTRRPASCATPMPATTSRTLVAAPRMQTAVMAIANIGEEIRQNGHAYGYTVVKLERRAASADERLQLKLRPGESAIVSIESLHLADGRPFCHESRLINADLVPEADLAELSREPAGAWLLRKVPWSSAEHAIRAINPPAAVARPLGVQPSTACLQIERFTEHNGLPVTFTRLIYPGDQHQLMASFAP
jgi:DNA-binding GntR family transcriptional regulator